MKNKYLHFSHPQIKSLLSKSPDMGNFLGNEGKDEHEHQENKTSKNTITQNVLECLLDSIQCFRELNKSTFLVKKEFDELGKDFYKLKELLNKQKF